MADITVVVIGVAVAVAVVVIVLFGVLFVYCRRRVKLGTNIRRRVVEDEEIVKVRPPLDIPPRQEMIQDVVYRPPTPPPPRDAYLERRGSWPKRDPNPDYVIVHKKHHHGRHRRRPSFEADRRIYRSGTRGDSYSSSSEDESESAHSGTHMRGARPMPVYPQPYPVPVATTLVPSAQPIVPFYQTPTSRPYGIPMPMPPMYGNRAPPMIMFRQ